LLNLREVEALFIRRDSGEMMLKFGLQMGASLGSFRNCANQTEAKGPPTGLSDALNFGLNFGDKMRSDMRALLDAKWPVGGEKRKCLENDDTSTLSAFFFQWTGLA